MNHKLIIILMFSGLVSFSAAGQRKHLLPLSSSLLQSEEKMQNVRSVVSAAAHDSMPVEYPMQQHYHKLFLNRTVLPFFRIADLTPPSPPNGLVATTSGIFSVYLQFNPSVDAESGISYYAFAIGTTPGSANIRYWQSLGTSTVTQSFSLKSLGIAEGSIFYFTVYAVNGAGLQSAYASSPPVTMNWENFGDSTNNITVLFSDSGYSSNGITPAAGWNASQIAVYNHFLSRMLPIIKDIYGPPSKDQSVTIVRNLYYSNSNIYFPGSNEIHKDDSFNPQLLTHELLHAWRDDVILAMDSNWSYHPKLSGFEESFAQGASYACMNRYVQLYPNDTVVDPASLYGSSMDWDYDFRNVHNITSEDFWSDYGGMGLHWERYEMGAAAMRKMQLEDSLFYKKFNNAWYAFLNANHHATPARNTMISLIESVLEKVEGIPSSEWINKQRIFDCEYMPGRKTWVRTQHYPWTEFIIFQHIYHYETFSNGSDWAYYDNAGQFWVYYSLNGSAGTGTLFSNGGTPLRNKNLLISGNPAGFGSQKLNLSTDNDVMPWPGGDTSQFLLNRNQLELYRVNTTFASTIDTIYRVMGNSLRNTSGIFGGLLHAKGGSLYIDHESYPSQPPLTVVNGAFHGNRSWASVPNNTTGGIDSKPGKVRFMYTDSLGATYRTYRNIDYGSWSGNQAFLLNVNEMHFCSTEIFSNNEDDDCDGLTDELSPIVFNLKLYIEGLYQASNSMNSALHNSAGGNASDADSLLIKLHSAGSPYSVIHSVHAIVSINGELTFNVPAVLANNSFYLSVKHRNSLETWSKEPVVIDRAEINYRFNE